AAPSHREAYLSFRHAVEFRRGVLGKLDLHWCSLQDRLDDRGERAFWRASVTATLDGQEVRVLAPPDQLVPVCAHGHVWSPIPPIRWAADAWLLLAHAGAAFDWDRLVTIARMRSLSYVVARGLEYLRDGLDAKVPSSVVERLRRDAGLPSRIEWRLRHGQWLA